MISRYDHQDALLLYAPNPAYLSMDEMKVIVDEAKLLRVKVAAHATNDIAVRRAVEAGVDSIEHGYEVKDETLALMKQRALLSLQLTSTTFH